MRVTWRRQKREKGLAGVCQGPRGVELWESGGKDRVGIVSAHTIGWTRDIDGYYWYGLGNNSFNDHRLYATEEEAKAALLEFYRAHKEGLR